MANPDNIVTVSITIADASVTRTGFGTAMIMTHEAAFGPDLVRTYSSTTAMVTDGHSATGATVLAATAIQAQNPRVVNWKVGRRTSTPSTQTRVVTVASVVDNTDYTITINGTPFTIDSGSSATNLTIATALFTAINAGAEPVTAVDNADGTLDLTEDVDGVTFGLTVTRDLLTQDDTTVAAAVATDYANIKIEDNDFYGVMMTSSATLEIVALAAAVEADRKLYLAQSADSDILSDTAGNLFETLNTAGYNRTAVLWKGNNHQYGDAAWMGRLFPKTPGSATWAFKSLAGVSTDILSDTQISNIESNYGNHYTLTKGLPLTLQGWASSGRYLDITRGIDWLTIRTQESIITLLANSDKVGYNQPGIDALEAAVRARLDEGIGNKLIEPGYTVTPKALSTISTATKASRVYGDIEFSATLTGAIHKVTIAGTVSA
jgi:hypothetical protein